MITTASPALRRGDVSAPLAVIGRGQIRAGDNGTASSRSSSLGTAARIDQLSLVIAFSSDPRLRPRPFCRARSDRVAEKLAAVEG